MGPKILSFTGNGKLHEFSKGPSKPCSHLMSSFAPNVKNGIYGIKGWRSHSFFDDKDQRNMQTQTLRMNQPYTERQ